ncbi:MAG TPA: M1 family aminopeptidase [Bacteroidales bacterium]
MVKRILSGVMLLISLSAQAQSYYNIYEVDNLFKKREYNKIVLKTDTLLRDYPNNAQIHYAQGIAFYNLNDYYAARKSLLKAKELGFKKEKVFIDFITSKQYVIDLEAEYMYPSRYAQSNYNDWMKTFTRKDTLQGKLTPLRTCYDVYYYDLTVKILPKSKSIEGVNKIFFKTTTQTDQIQIDLFRRYIIKSITWNKRELEFKREYNAVFINFGEVLPADSNYILTIEYYGKPIEAPRPPWNGGFVWEKGRSKWWVGVACEHLGASSWWPCKDHLSEKPDSMCINIQVPKKYQAIANGNLRSSSPVDKNYTNYEWFVSYPINSYGVTFYMGDFINFNEDYISGQDTCKIDYYVLPQHLEKAEKYYERTQDIVKVFEELFGEYPYKKDGIAFVEAPYKGMEHQGAIAIGDDYNTKENDDNFKNTNYNYLIVHEFAHEWWGNTVTMSDMADAWISEGFANYSENLFLEKKFGYKQYIKASASNMRYILNIWPMVGARDVNDNSFMGGDIYSKGASMLNNLRCIINNDKVFFAMIKKFQQDNQFKTITSSDFVCFVNDYTGNDYTDFFNKFLYDDEPPVLEYSYTLENGLLSFTYKWINVGSSFTMPFSISINYSENFRIEGTTEYQTINLKDVNTFYLPNERRFNLDYLTKNSFTYYWTSWKK